MHKKTFLATVLILILPIVAGAEDLIEFLSGAKAVGTVIKIDKQAKQIEFEAKIGASTLSRVYSYSKIHAITYQGQRYVLNEKTVGTSPRPTAAANGSTDTTGTSGGASGRRTAAEVNGLIQQLGRTPPDWYDSTPLDYPRTLDLSWPEPAPKGWNNQKNMGQYIWDIVNPNADRWRSGVRLMHHLLAIHKDDRQVQLRVMQSLGGMYFRFFQDYARAAFWWQQAGVQRGVPDAVGLAECYWRLGNRQMAETMILDPERDRGGTLQVGMIKLWGDMGETTKAIKMADWYVKVGGPPHLAYLLAGDACRFGGRYQEAVNYYQKVIDTPVTGTQNKVDQTIARARASMQAVKLFELSDVTKVADGTYRDSSLGYEGPIEVEVAVKSGRIDSVRVTRHTEKQFYSALTDVPNQIIEKQGVKGVDATSRATITAEAIINATAKALARGAK